MTELKQSWLNAIYQFIWGTGPRRVITALILTRAFIFLVGIRAMQFLPKFEGMPIFGHPIFIDMWIRGDAGWYLTIANAGYQYIPGQMSSAGYFPLFPLLMRAIGMFSDNAIGGLLVSNCALILAVIVLYRLLKLDVDSQTSSRAILYLLVFPASLFLSSIHSEALFLLTTVSSFYAARKGNWMLAGVFGALATLTRSTGVLILLALLVEYAFQKGIKHWRDYSKVTSELAWLSLIPLALLGFAGYLYAKFGTPFAYINTQVAINTSLSYPFSKVVELFLYPTTGSLLGAAFMVLCVFLIAYAWKTERPSYLVYASLIMLASLATIGTYASYRYMSTVFPFFLILAKITENKPALHYTIVWTSVATLAFFMSLFVRGWLLV